MTAHPLDRPVWNALTTRQRAVSVGDDRARRFASDVGSLAGTRDDDPESLRALTELVPAAGTLIVLQVDPIAIPPGTVVVMTAPAVQMVAERVAAPPPDAMPDPMIDRLTDDDAPAMLALATLTKPGPFAPRTHSLGEFWGVKDRGVLVAMAGERLQHHGFTEVSGVCTHPDARGRGFARALSAHVAARIAARGDTPYLHAFAANTAAIALYQSLGFALRGPVHIAAIARA